MAETKGDDEHALVVAMFHALASSSEGYVSCVDRERRVRFLNRTRSRDVSNVLGRRAEEFVAEPQREAFVQAIEQAFVRREAQSLEYDAVLADGSRTWLLTQVVPFEGPEGQALALQVTTDLSEQRRLIAELSKSEQFRKLIVENLPDYVILLDRERRFRWINRMEGGRSPSLVVGRRLDEFVPAQTLHVAQQAVESVFATGEPTVYESEVPGPNGQTVWYSTRAVRVVGEGAEDNVLLISSDVSHSRRAEIALRDSEARFRAVAEHSPDLIAIVNTERQIEYVNREPGGRQPGHSVGQNLAEFMRPVDLVLAKRTLDAVFGAGLTGEYECSDSKLGLLYRVRVAPLEGMGNRARALVVFTDITQLRADERARESLQAQLHQAQRRESIGTLAGGIAHDFNNLLQVIQTNLHFAQELVGAANLATEELSEAIRATDRAAELTAHLLAIGRRQRVDPKPLDFSKLIDRSLRMLRRVIPENIELKFEPSELPCTVSADSPQLEQVLLNLCLNARDAMPSGGKLTVSVSARKQSPPRALLRVSDTGTGISEDQLKRVFEPFFTTKGAGSGLGLAVVAGIVAAHNGNVSVDSKLGQGSTFTVELPLVAAPELEQNAQNGERVRGHELILVAEDEPLVRAQVVRILKRAGYAVLEAEDGIKALASFDAKRDEIDLVLLDVIMPGLDGWQVFSRLEALRPSVKVLFTTGYAANALPEDFGSRGKRLLSKPYKPQALLELVREVLDSN